MKRDRVQQVDSSGENQRIYLRACSKRCHQSRAQEHVAALTHTLPDFRAYGQGLLAVNRAVGIIIETIVTNFCILARVTLAVLITVALVRVRNSGAVVRANASKMGQHKWLLWRRFLSDSAEYRNPGRGQAQRECWACGSAKVRPTSHFPGVLSMKIKHLAHTDFDAFALAPRPYRGGESWETQRSTSILALVATRQVV